jgi:hypothetical protein
MGSSSSSEWCATVVGPANPSVSTSVVPAGSTQVHVTDESAACMSCCVLACHQVVLIHTHLLVCRDAEDAGVVSIDLLVGIKHRMQVLSQGLQHTVGTETGTRHSSSSTQWCKRSRWMLIMVHAVWHYSTRKARPGRVLVSIY